MPMNRQDLLDSTAESAGAEWATARLGELGAEGRASGGWPGTLGEARGRAALAIGIVLRAHRMLAMSHDERARAATIAYEAARRAWLHVARPGA